MFKKRLTLIITAILAFFVLLTVTSCNKEKTPKNETTTNIKAEETLQSLTNTKNEFQKTESDLDSGGADLALDKYRRNYYCIPAPFADVVDSEEFEKWYGEILLLNPNETNKMLIKEYILQFDVPREDFEKANLEWARIVEYKLNGMPVMNPQDFANQETDEVYNADILYSFDDEIINNYYLSHDYPYTYSDEYKEAVANGTYTPKTEKWIDIEEMEAEIIAKYGEAEIVTETATIYDEVIVTDSTQSEIPEETTSELINE